MSAVHDVPAVDLNLLRVLDALLQERHLTRAGKRIGLTQSATSHALARLRRLFDDPLFVRTARGLTPTRRAEALAAPAREAMLAFERCFRPDEAFVPATAERRFTLGCADYGAFVLAPKLLEALQRGAPNLDLAILPLEKSVTEQLARGDVDVVVNPALRGELPAGIRSRLLFRERFVCLVRQGNPAFAKRIDVARWASMPHLLVAPRGTPGGVVDETLAQLGKRRRVMLTVPHFLLAPHLVANSDMVLTIGARVAQRFAELLPVRVVEPPVKLPGFEVRMYWHERNHLDPAQQWFRDLVRNSCAD